MAYMLVGKIEAVPYDIIVMSEMAGFGEFGATERATLVRQFKHDDHIHIGYIGSSQRNLGQIVKREEELHHAGGHRKRAFNPWRAKRWGVYVTYEDGHIKDPTVDAFKQYFSHTITDLLVEAERGS